MERTVIRPGKNGRVLVERESLFGAQWTLIQRLGFASVYEAWQRARKWFGLGVEIYPMLECIPDHDPRTCELAPLDCPDARCRSYVAMALETSDILARLKREREQEIERAHMKRMVKIEDRAKTARYSDLISVAISRTLSRQR